jgi:mRNA-degrading endonuclease RelE of RelBE toxin-antitoxin system
MSFDVQYSEEAVEQLKRLRRFDQVAILDQIEKMLRINPTLVSKAKIKLLRQPAPTQYRLRIRDFRVYYDVDGPMVRILQILSKEDSIGYLGETS